MSDWPSDAWLPPPAAPPPPSAAPPWADQAPGWQQPGRPNPPYAPGPYGAPPSNNGFAIASLVAGCAQFMLCGIGAILAIVFGHVARGQIKRSNGAQTGRGLATAGLVLGYVGLVVTVLGAIGVIVGVFAFSDDIERHEMRDDARDFVETAQQQAFTTSSDVRDADVLRSAFYDVELDSFGRDAVLADGSSMSTATDADWARNGWRFELHSDTPGGDVYVCATVPEAVNDRVIVTNGQCPAGA
jgi:hypothetical protein